MKWQATSTSSKAPKDGVIGRQLTLAQMYGMV